MTSVNEDDIEKELNEELDALRELKDDELSEDEVDWTWQQEVNDENDNAENENDNENSNETSSVGSINKQHSDNEELSTRTDTDTDTQQHVPEKDDWEKELEREVIQYSTIARERNVERSSSNHPTTSEQIKQTSPKISTTEEEKCDSDITSTEQQEVVNSINPVAIAIKSRYDGSASICLSETKVAEIENEPLDRRQNLLSSLDEQRREQFLQLEKERAGFVNDENERKLARKREIDQLRFLLEEEAKKESARMAIREAERKKQQEIEAHAIAEEKQRRELECKALERERLAREQQWKVAEEARKLQEEIQRQEMARERERKQLEKQRRQQELQAQREAARIEKEKAEAEKRLQEIERMREELRKKQLEEEEIRKRKLLEAEKKRKEEQERWEMEEKRKQEREKAQREKELQDRKLREKAAALEAERRYQEEIKRKELEERERQRKAEEAARIQAEEEAHIQKLMEEQRRELARKEEEYRLHALKIAEEQERLRQDALKRAMERELEIERQRLEEERIRQQKMLLAQQADEERLRRETIMKSIAALKIQTIWRGHKVRKFYGTEIQNRIHTIRKVRNAAAKMIQATFRGWRLRKRFTAIRALSKFEDDDEWDYGGVDEDWYTIEPLKEGEWELPIEVKSALDSGNLDMFLTSSSSSNLNESSEHWIPDDQAHRTNDEEEDVGVNQNYNDLGAPQAHSTQHNNTLLRPSSAASSEARSEIQSHRDTVPRNANVAIKGSKVTNLCNAWGLQDPRTAAALLQKQMKLKKMKKKSQALTSEQRLQKFLKGTHVENR